MARPREFDFDRVLIQAMEVFWEQGYQGTSIQNLMKATGVQKQSLYCAFGDKRSLFVQSLRLYCERTLEDMEKMLRGTGSPLERIERFLLYASEKRRSKSGPSGCLMTNTALEIGRNDRLVAAEVKKMFRGFEGILMDVVKEGKERGEITTRFTSAAIAQSLVNTVSGMRVLEKTGASSKRAVEVVELALAAVRS